MADSIVKQGKYFCFTLFEVNPENIIEKPDDMGYLVYQLEMCPESNREHYQGYVEFQTNKRLNFLKKWLPTAHFQNRRARTGEEAAAYCKKEETRVSGPWEFGAIFISKQGKRTDLDEACELLRESKSLRTVARTFPTAYAKFGRGFRELLTQLKELPKDEDFKLLPWQETFMKKLEAPADDRTIYWIYDHVGKKGKSRLSKHLQLQHEAVALGGKLVDMCYLYNEEPIVIFDLSRSQEEFTGQYYAMAENLKNGIIVSTKYECVRKVFKPPHVIFMSNFYPDTEKWTGDRLKLINLQNVSQVIDE